MTRQEVKRLLAKGLTGWEAARLIIADSVEVDHGREGFLSSADIEMIKNSLTNPADIQDYGNWIQAYQLVDYSIKEASIHALEAERELLWAIGQLNACWVESEARMMLLVIKDKNVRQMVSGLSALSVFTAHGHRKTNFTVGDFVKAVHRSATEHIKVLLAVRAVVEAISQAIGVKLTEDLDQRLSDIQRTVSLYNAQLDMMNNEVRQVVLSDMGIPKLRGLKIGTLKPAASAIKYYVSRMNMALGEGWWPGTIDGIKFLGGLNFLEAEEADSLAAEVVQEAKQKFKELEGA